MDATCVNAPAEALSLAAATAQAAQVQAQAAAVSATQQALRVQSLAATATTSAQATQVAASATAAAQASATQQISALATTVAAASVTGPSELTTLIKALLGPGHPLFDGNAATLADYRSAREFVVSQQGWPTEKATVQQDYVNALDRAHVQRVYAWQQASDPSGKVILSVLVYDFQPGPDVRAWFDAQQTRDTKNTSILGDDHRILTDPRIGDERGYLWARGVRDNGTVDNFYYGFIRPDQSAADRFVVRIVGRGLGAIAPAHALARGISDALVR